MRSKTRPSSSWNTTQNIVEVEWQLEGCVERVEKRSAAWVTGCHLEWLGMNVLRESRMRRPLMRPLLFPEYCHSVFCTLVSLAHPHIPEFLIVVRKRSIWYFANLFSLLYQCVEIFLFGTVSTILRGICALFGTGAAKDLGFMRVPEKYQIARKLVPNKLQIHSDGVGSIQSRD